MPSPSAARRPAVSERDPASLARYLGSFRWSLRDETEATSTIATGLPLWRHIVSLVPDRERRGRALELGSPPFHITLLLQRLRDYDLELTAATIDGRSEVRQTLESPEHGERFELVCRCFDVERDAFPYPDAHFDLVLWCEVIEHLTSDPVHALAEIHRVLAPGGTLVISTPNVARASNLATLLRGRSIYDPYHLGCSLAGTRHAREYTAAELRELVSGCGFTIEQLEDVDCYPRRLLGRAASAVLRAAGRLTGGRHGAHLFLRARRTAEPFRWHYPAALFDPTHLRFHLAPHASRIVLGENEALHVAPGFGPLEAGPLGRTMRRCSIGDVHLRANAVRPRVRLSLTDGEGDVSVWHGRPAVLLAWERVAAPAGSWHDATVALGADARPGEPLQVHIAAPHGIGVHAVELCV